MTFATWCVEHYPKPADEAVGSDLEAAEHSLAKWEGLLPEALAKHGVEAYGRSLREAGSREGIFWFDGTNCSLCLRRQNVSCRKCPLHLARDGYDCTETRPNELVSPWKTAMVDPRPMIFWLRRAVEYVKAQPDNEYDPEGDKL
jgi:hypothetical protein